MHRKKQLFFCDNHCQKRDNARKYSHCHIHCHDNFDNKSSWIRLGHSGLTQWSGTVIFYLYLVNVKLPFQGATNVELSTK